MNAPLPLPTLHESCWLSTSVDSVAMPRSDAVACAHCVPPDQEKVSAKDIEDIKARFCELDRNSDGTVDKGDIGIERDCNRDEYITGDEV